MGSTSKVGALSLCAGSSVWRRWRRYGLWMRYGVGMDDGWTLDLWNEGPQTERVHTRTETVQFVL